MSIGCGSGFGYERGPNFHEQDSKAIAAFAVTAVSPVTVIARVLDQCPVASSQQHFAQLRVLRELRPQSFAHEQIVLLRHEVKRISFRLVRFFRGFHRLHQMPSRSRKGKARWRIDREPLLIRPVRP